MADNYLEYHREDYERRKAQWLAKQKRSHAPKKRINNPATSETSAVALTNTINMKNQIATTNAPAAIGPYSQAVEANGTIYISGQLPIDPATGNFVEGGIKELTRQSLTNIKNILEAAGTDMKHAVKMGVFLADMSFLRFCTICGSKLPSRSCGTSIGISPYELRNFLCFTPFR